MKRNIHFIHYFITDQNTRKLRKSERKSGEYFWPDSNVDIAWENTEQQGGNDWKEQSDKDSLSIVSCPCILIFIMILYWNQNPRSIPLCWRQPRS